MKRKKQQKVKLIGKCKLCLEEKELLSKSHILPKFLLKQMLTNEQRGFAVLSLDASHIKFVSDYAYEPGILCANCDNKILSKYEDYGSKFLFGSLGKNDLLKAQSHYIHYYIENVNYHKLKLFFLSLLWRCSIASSNIFQKVKLDNKVEEEIRLILLEDKYTPEERFPITLLQYMHIKEVPLELIFPPWIGNKIDGEQNFHFIGGGLFLQLIIEYEKLTPINEEAMLKESGIVKVVDIPAEPMKAIVNKLVHWQWLK